MMWTNTRKAHWETVYKRSRPESVGWYQPHLKVSFDLLARAGLCPDSRIIDIGGGASTLVDDLLQQGIKDIAVLDIAGQALAVSKGRLGERSGRVKWMESDITQAQLPEAYYDIWHDRAVFHFLTKAQDRHRYMAVLREALRPGGYAILATFSPQGPPRCAGLAVVRYSPETLQAELGDGFRLMETLVEDHQTPLNTTQKFIYSRFQKL